jgi:hypothetical protein
VAYHHLVHAHSRAMLSKAALLRHVIVAKRKDILLMNVLRFGATAVHALGTWPVVVHMRPFATIAELKVTRTRTAPCVQLVQMDVSRETKMAPVAAGRLGRLLLVVSPVCSPDTPGSP